ncbi:MAG: hypothetical protein U0746_14155 [Gemmataceae bacterium]
MRTKRRGLGNLILLAGLAGGPGCVTLCPKPLDLPPECVQACQQVPSCSRGRVFVFLVDGLDPLAVGCVGTVRRTLVGLGFNKVYDGYFYHVDWFAEEMCRLHAEEPDTRFVVVGVSTGATTAQSLAESVAAAGVGIELLAVVDGPLWGTANSVKPGNVVNMVRVPDAATAVMPLIEELTAIARSVPVPIRELPPPVVEELPPPRPVSRSSEGARDAWDFLKPVARLGESRTEPMRATEHTTLREKNPETP